MNRLFPLCKKLQNLGIEFKENRFVKCNNYRHKWDVVITENKFLFALYTPDMSKNKQFKEHCAKLRSLGYTILIIPSKMVSRHVMLIEIFIEASKEFPGVKWFTGTPESFNETVEEIKQTLQQPRETIEFIESYNQDQI